jgi:hypothetical protein
MTRAIQVGGREGRGDPTLSHRHRGPYRVWKALGLFPVFKLLRLFHLRWQARDMGPMHPDLHEVVTEINILERTA